jgi:hypothetical protein
MISKMPACLILPKLLNISAFLLNAVWAAMAELPIGIMPVFRRWSGGDKAQHALIQAQKRYFTGVHMKQLGESRADAPRRRVRVKHRFQRMQMFGWNAFFCISALSVYRHRFSLVGVASANSRRGRLLLTSSGQDNCQSLFRSSFVFKVLLPGQLGSASFRPSQCRQSDTLSLAGLITSVISLWDQDCLLFHSGGGERSPIRT